MDRSPSPTFLMAAAIGSALLGQFFMAQKDSASSLFGGCFFYFLSVPLFVSSIRSEKKTGVLDAPLPPLAETLFFAGAMMVALFFRLFRLNFFPSSIFTDQAFNGWAALRILHEGWVPVLGDYDRSNGVLTYCYLLAAWFKWVPPSQVTYWLFTVIQGLLFLPLFYWAVRLLSGPRIALAALFILGVMRWQVTFCRNGHIAVQVPLFLAGALVGWLYGLKAARRPWVGFMASALCTGAALGTYQAAKATLILMAVYATFEWARGGFPGKARAAHLLPAVAVLVPFAWPLLADFLKTGDLTHRPDTSIFPWIWQGGLSRIILQVSKTALMFNRSGDLEGLLNIPGHRMLDDVTGIFFILGFSLCLLRIFRREYFYPLAGMAVFCLPALLTHAPAGASRALGTTPFVAWLAALALEAFHKKLNSLNPGAALKVGSLLAGLALGSMALENFYDYFVLEARNPQCRGDAFSTEGSAAGRAIARFGNGYEYYMASHFYGRYDVLFLAYSQKDHLHPLDLPQDLAPPPPPTSRGLFFILDEGKGGVLEILRDLYPEGRMETYTDLEGAPRVHFYRVPPAAIAADAQKARTFLSKPFGLKGEYFLSPAAKGPPSAVRQDPVLNFTFRNDFPVQGFPPLAAVWSGLLETPASGFYRFLGLTYDSAEMSLDGKKIFSKGSTESADFFLSKGFHHIHVTFRKTSGTDTAFSLLWKKPGNNGFELVPYKAFQGTFSSH